MPLYLIRQDIAKMKVDAIVNAANHTLLCDGGVGDAMHRAVGSELLAACAALAFAVALFAFDQSVLGASVL